MRRFCGETVHAEFANLEMTSFCPACLLQDVDTTAGSIGQRIGRVNWMIRHYRTCEVHKIGLFRRKNTSRIERLQQMDDVAPDNETLMRMIEAAQPQRVSGLQRYVTQRLAGQRGPDWLDDQPIDLAARACEMLGIILTAGTHANLKLLSESDWNDAGHVGFGYASRGQAGIESALRTAKDHFDDEGLKGGPQKALGRLYQWLQFKRNNKPTGPIGNVVREFILDNFPIERGADLFGETVDHQRVHSVYSLAKLTGDHPKTINRAMVLSGLMEGHPDKVSGNKTFNAEAGEKLITRVQNSMPVTKLPAYLNCNRVQAEQLVRTGIIPNLTNNDPRATGVLKQVAIEDADAFLEQLMKAAEQKPSASKNVIDIVTAAGVARWPVMDIVNGILNGLFKVVEVVESSLKFKGVMVDPREVRDALVRQNAEGRVSLDEGAKIIGMPKSGLSVLAKLRAPDGTLYVRDHWLQNSKGAKMRVFERADLEQFRKQHISLKEIAEAADFSPRVMKMKLDVLGLTPVVPRFELGRIWYRRDEVPTV